MTPPALLLYTYIPSARYCADGVYVEPNRAIPAAFVLASFPNCTFDTLVAVVFLKIAVLLPPTTVSVEPLNVRFASPCKVFVVPVAVTT